VSKKTQTKKKKMNINTTAGTVLLCLLAFFIILYYFTRHFLLLQKKELYMNISKDIFLCIVILLNIIAIAFLFYTSEQFYFEVSPERKRCLINQVSLHEKPLKTCCGKGFTGGILPQYEEWKQMDGRNKLWKRTDNYTCNPHSDGYITQIPPTELV